MNFEQEGFEDINFPADGGDFIPSARPSAFQMEDKVYDVNPPVPDRTCGISCGFSKKYDTTEEELNLVNQKILVREEADRHNLSRSIRLGEKVRELESQTHGLLPGVDFEVIEDIETLRKEAQDTKRIADLNKIEAIKLYKEQKKLEAKQSSKK